MTPNDGKVPDHRAVHVVGAAIFEDTANGPRVLAVRRGPAMRLAGRWEFPGGKVEPHETPERALAREVHEELGIEIEVGGWLAQGTASVGALHITLDVYGARRLSGELGLTEHDALLWLGAAQLHGVPWAEADLPALPAVRQLLEHKGA